MKQYIDQKSIIKFVKAVEEKKKYRRKPGLVIRHLFEEVAECSAELWKHQYALKHCEKNYKNYTRENVARELIDVLSIVVLLADILGIDLNKSFPWRKNEVNKQYEVEEKSK